MHPDAPSRVVRARHAGVWANQELVPRGLRQMLDSSITALTGLNDARSAWAALFRPNERIAIKVNTIAGSAAYTHVPLVMAIAEPLVDAGVPAEQIVIWDRDAYELTGDGYTLNKVGPGVRCRATAQNYTPGWRVMDTPTKLSNILLNCDALTVVLGDNWDAAVPGDSIFMSFDPVAHDTIGLRLLSEVRTAAGKDPASYVERANPWLVNAAALGLGTNDAKSIQMSELALR